MVANCVGLMTETAVTKDHRTTALKTYWISRKSRGKNWIRLSSCELQHPRNWPVLQKHSRSGKNHKCCEFSGEGLRLSWQPQHQKSLLLRKIKRTFFEKGVSRRTRRMNKVETHTTADPVRSELRRINKGPSRDEKTTGIYPFKNILNIFLK